MLGFGVLIGLVILAVPVLIIVLLVGQSKLKERIERLEYKLQDLQLEKPHAQPVPRAAPPSSEPVPEPVAPAAEPIAPVLASRLPSADPVTSALPPSVNQNQPLVMRPDRVAALLEWVRVNWVYVISAVSLAFAGIFFVQYGMERGLLPPGLRVLAAMAFGAALIGAGEWLRRRHGDEGQTSTVHLPSVFSGAGLVSIFAAILAARQLYGLIGPEVAFAGHLLAAILAVVLGWFYGPLLVAVGLIGAALSPFIVSGGATAGAWLYAYFALIAAVGLAVDSWRRWAWVSVLALVLGYAGVVLVNFGGAGLPGLIAALLALVALALTIPVRRLLPDHAGNTVSQNLFSSRPSDWPSFPTRLAVGTVVASSVGLGLVAMQVHADAMLGFWALTILALALLLWAAGAEALRDAGFVPSAALLAALFVQPSSYPSLATGFAAQSIASRAPDLSAPLTVTLLLGMAGLISAAFAFASFRPGVFARVYALAAVLMAPLAAAVFELLWHPAPVLGAFPWALHIMAVAAGMVALATAYARRDGADHNRMAYATLSALALIALALFVVLTDTALTLSLAALVVVAAALDRRFRLPEMGIFMQIALAVTSYRLLVDPGLDWALRADLGTVMLAFVASIVACLAALWLLAPMARDQVKSVLESAAVALMAILANVLITRWLTPAGMPPHTATHWGATLNAMPWLVLMLVQAYRARLGCALQRLRQILASAAGVLAALGLATAAVLFNPLFGGAYDELARVIGPPILDSLALAYAIPAVILLLAGWKLPGLAVWARTLFLAVGAALLLLYTGLEIRRLWQGDWLGAPVVLQGELYSYTIAMMLIGAGLLYQAIARPSDLLRRMGMAVIAATVVKVFFWDAAGLTGLTRVASFAGLGLALAGLAWLNRWAGQRAIKG
ncbi:DUF2339 domain-containing protein [Tabrizicola sp.]|uniref:DUF2339 domain-containing protein n=1 Tax=Tabrizicola sp. TaxID=2005166 RepID=UPI00286B771D|nr:DUF2339 domain-containing protein [Tabrizicola sp.]